MFLNKQSNRIKFREIRFREPNNSRNFLDLISRMSLKTAENGNFWAQIESFDWFLHPNAMLKISRGLNFASQQSHTFSRVLISRNREI